MELTYKEFIDNILETRGRNGCGEEYHETHHIVPKCLGGTNDKENLIDLFAREHFEAHRLLALENPENEKLVYAWWMMCTVFNSSQQREKVSAEKYEEVRKIISNTMSKVMSGRTLSEKTKKKLSEINKKENLSKETLNKRSRAMTGHKVSKDTKEKLRMANTGKHLSQETKTKIGEANKNIIFSEERKEKIRKALKGRRLSEEHKIKLKENHADFSGENHPMYGKYHSYESKKKMSESHKGKPLSEEAKEKLRKPIYCIETGVTYDSARKAESKLKIHHSNISKVCCGKAKTTGGYHWKYIYTQTFKDGTIIPGAITLGLITEEEALRQLEEQREEM